MDLNLGRIVKKVVLAHVELTMLGTSYQKAGNNDKHLFNLLKEKVELDPIIEWCQENNVEVQFDSVKKLDTWTVIAYIWADLTTEQNMEWRLKFR